jgi:methionyl-tRNA formyltransferase
MLLGMGPTALTALESLAAVADVVAILRDIDDVTDPIRERSSELGVPLIPDMRPEHIARLVAELRVECLVISSYNRILSQAVIDSVPCINVHYSPLPKYRGRANVNWALINGEQEVALTVHVVESGLDSGNILFQESLPIGARDSIGDLYAKLNSLQRVALGETVLRYLDGYRGFPQDEQYASYGCSRNPEDGEIVWSQSTSEIDRLIRSLGDPFPGAFTHFNNRLLKVWSAEPLGSGPHFIGRVPGRVVNVSPENGYIDVLTGDSTLRILEVQLPGQGRVFPAEIIKSVRATLGLRSVDLLRKIEDLERQLRGSGTSAGSNQS